jgi:isocitrate/isopropylmalate dehydrogenase
MQAPRLRVAVIPGDDAAPEAVLASLEVLRALQLPVEWVVLPDGEVLSRQMSPQEMEELVRRTVDSCHTALFGATSGKTRGIGYLRWGKETYANVRPVRWRPGYRSPLRHPQGIDYVIVRENLEDLYLGVEGELTALAQGAPELLAPRYRPGYSYLGQEGRFALKVVSRSQTERVAHFACRLALARQARGHPGKVTVGSKHNVLPRSDGFFRQVVAEVVAQYPGLAYQELLADDLARRLVASPQELDVVLLPNLYGDLLSDVAAGTIGGLGLAPSGCYGDSYAYFEPVHGTAPDIAGRHIINPTATLLSAAMMLEHLGLTEAAARLEAAVAAVYAAGGPLTPDQGGTASTEEFCQAVIARLEGGG